MNGLQQKAEEIKQGNKEVDNLRKNIYDLVDWLNESKLSDSDCNVSDEYEQSNEQDNHSANKDNEIENNRTPKSSIMSPSRKRKYEHKHNSYCHVIGNESNFVDENIDKDDFKVLSK